jgi:hypothetical protein
MRLFNEDVGGPLTLACTAVVRHGNHPRYSGIDSEEPGFDIGKDDNQPSPAGGFPD